MRFPWRTRMVSLTRFCRFGWAAHTPVHFAWSLEADTYCIWCGKELHEAG